MDPRIRIWIHTKMSWIRNTLLHLLLMWWLAEAYLCNGWQQAQLDAPPPGSGDQEVPETEGEILKVDSAVSVMIQVSEYDVTVGLAETKEINVIN
jgi:hypothetical protein